MSMFSRTYHKLLWVQGRGSRGGVQGFTALIRLKGRLSALADLSVPLYDLSPVVSSSSSRSFVCGQCGRSYRHASSLLNHKNSHKTGTFFCNSCQKEFPNLMSLKNHRRIHTEPKRYQCPDCGKSFRVSTALVCHRRIHTKEKPFSCQQCSKCFSSKSNLRHHMKVHWKSPPLSRGRISAFLAISSRPF